MRLGVHAPGVATGSRLERAALGLVARGHALARAGRAATDSALASLEQARPDAEVDVLLAAGGAAAAALAAARLHAGAVVLSLDAASHAGWGLFERWAWDRSGAWGLIEERALDHFLARTSAEERERVALWPEASPDGTAPALQAETEVLERACERALARRVAGPGRAALFVDRDGTLIYERDHLSDPDDVELLPGVGEALRQVRRAGHPVVVISNQAGVGRGLFPESRVYDVMARLRRLLRAQGVELDAVRYCPHAPDAGCDCRKPGGRLLREAADDLRISLRDSVMVGDKWIDVDAGRGVGAAGVLVRTGYGAGEEQRSDARPQPDTVVDDLPAAARWFLERTEA